MLARALVPCFLSLTLTAATACGDDDDDAADDDSGDVTDDGGDVTDDGDDTSDDGGDDGGSVSLVDVAAQSGDFDTLVGALEATGLDVTLSGDGPFTVFAPTDAAFDRLPEGVLASLDAETLAQILTYHVVAGEVLAADVVELDSATTVEGSDVAIRVIDGTVVLDGTVQVTATDVLADNGVIHVVDSVLLPPSIPFPGTLVDAAAAYPIFDPLVDAVETADLAGALSGDNGGDGLTLLAPTSFAFAEVDVAGLTQEELSEVLLYHVIGGTVDSTTIVGLTEAETLQGGTIGIAVEDGAVVLDDAATVIRTDLVTDNGILHVIDAVLLPELP